MVEQKNVVTI